MQRERVLGQDRPAQQRAEVQPVAGLSGEFGSKKKVANVTMLTMIRIKTVAMRRRTMKVTMSVSSSRAVPCRS